MAPLEHVAQPDMNTCQSAALARVLGTTDVMKVRYGLLDIAAERRSMAGDPLVMRQYCEARLPNYSYNANASINDMRAVWDSGGDVVVHGNFTWSGHVIGGSGYGWRDGAGQWYLGEPHPVTGLYYMRSEDPWDEFDFVSGRYAGIGPDAGNNKPYSFHGIYAYCVASWSLPQAEEVYASGRLDSNEKGAWLHCFWGDR